MRKKSDTKSARGDNLSLISLKESKDYYSINKNQGSLKVSLDMTSELEGVQEEQDLESK